MDFLDPRKQRAYHLRLRVGYVLMAIAIALAALVLVYDANGFSFNAKTRTIVQNGLLFVDSKPGGANISLNGSGQGTTSARMVLPAGNYTLKLSKDGYRTWQRKVEVDPSAVAYYVYPFLFPTTPVSTTMQAYSTAPGLVTQSPDHHWLLVQAPATDNNSLNFDEFNTAKPTQPAQVVSLPQNLITDPDATNSSFSLVEWSTDNNNVLLQHTYDGGTEFIVFDRDNPADSFNVNDMFNVSPTQVALRNKSVGQLYIYDQDDHTLRVGDTGKSELDSVFLRHVLAFKAYGTSLITYVTDNNEPSGKVQARIWDNGTTYPLYTFTAGDHYLIDAAQYQGHWYYIAGSDTDDRVDVFEDPLSTLQDKSIGKAYALIALRVTGADKVSFSNNARFVEIQNGQNFGVYDFETSTRFQYTIDSPLNAPLSWMDGSRLIGESSGQVFVMDYDGINQVKPGATIQQEGGYFSADFNHLFTVQPVPNSTSYRLVNLDMRAGKDLPKS